MTLADKVTQRLRELIQVGEFLPGERLDYRRLAARLGTSVTPIRESVMHLACEGFVTLVPRAGAVVRSPDYNEVAQLYEVRQAVEGYAVAITAARVSRAERWQLESLQAESEHWLARLQEAGGGSADGESLAKLRCCDFAFHSTIVEASGNPRLSVIASECVALLRLFGIGKIELSMDCLRESNSTHAQILQAIQGRDSAGAREHMIRHLDQDLELTLRHRRRFGNAMLTGEADLSHSLSPQLNLPPTSETSKVNAPVEGYRK